MSRDLARVPSNPVFLFVVAFVVIGDKTLLLGRERRARAARRIKFIPGMPLWAVVQFIEAGLEVAAAAVADIRPQALRSIRQEHSDF